MKHTLSVLVADESGALSRISGLFARRGFNIESLAVGPAEHRGVSRLTMVVEGDDRTLEQMSKQLNKLVNVLGVIDLSTIPAVERELMLLKVSAPAENRSAIFDLVQVFRAKVVDVADDALTLEVVGDPGKLVALERLLERLFLDADGRACGDGCGYAFELGLQALFLGFHLFFPLLHFLGF